MDRLDSAHTAVPHSLHHFVFEFREGRANMTTRCFTICHGTFCTSKRDRSQDPFPSPETQLSWSHTRQLHKERVVTIYAWNEWTEGGNL